MVAAYRWCIFLDIHYIALQQQFIGLEVVDRVFIVDECSHERLWQTYGHRLVESVDDVAAVFWVEVAQMFDIDIQYLCNLL